MNLSNIYSKIMLLTCISFLWISCQHSHDHGDQHGHSHGAHSDEKHHEEGLHLTKKQIETIGLQLGSFSELKINDYVKATGTLGLPPNAFFSVNAKAEGFVLRSGKFIEGSYLKKGAFIASVENPDFIEKQQSYLELKAELQYLEKELERQNTLVDENAGIQKTLDRVKADVAVKKAQLKGIEKYLSYIGIDIQETMKGDLRQSINVYAPVSGYISRVDAHNGMFVTPEKELMEIVDETHLHLELDVFEKDIALLKEEQKITYTIPALGKDVYEGEVHVLGKEFNTSNKTVRIHGHPEGKQPSFIEGLYVEAKIWINDATVQALPEKAVIKDGTSYFIYTSVGMSEEEEMHFEKKMVIPGTASDGFVSVKLIDSLKKNEKVVVKGTYYVFAQSKAGELTHEH